MTQRSKLEKAGVSLALCAVALVFSGTKACQEDYELGAQASVSRTGTPAATPTDSGDDQIATRTPTPSATIVASPTATPGVTVTVTPTPTRASGGVLQGGGAGRELLQELSALNERTAEQNAAAVNRTGAAARKQNNWLGRAFNKESQDSQSGWSDRDLDGFSDQIESEWDSDGGDPLSTPLNLLTTSLDVRVGKVDPDGDGLSTAEEQQRGTNPEQMDSDGDGKPDGAEVLSGSDPVNQESSYLDSDGDSLSDEYERESGLKEKNLDSDGDGLRDDLELAVGSNPLSIDSDGDGVADGREYDLGSDPTIADGSR
jgi:hypothetical protein